MVLGLGSFGAQEMLLLLLIVVVLFGARKIPDLARALGEGIRNFRSSVRGEEPDPSRTEPGERSKDAKL